ncbi:MAG: hypothetical protein MJ192_03755 [Clostridia bacterium]|nr:hypothetical protein [Clostridia bacterium]
MKTTSCMTRLIAVLLLCAAAVTCLASCGAAVTKLPGKAKVSGIYKQAEKNMNRADSMTMDMGMTLSWKLNGKVCRVTSSAKSMTETKPALRTITTTSVSSTVAGQAAMSRRSSAGFMDGKAFVSGGYNGVCSEMTEKEYLNWQASRTGGDEITTDMDQLLVDPDAAGVRECTTDEETGGYVLTFREVGKKNLKVFTAMTESLEQALPGVTLSDVELTARVTDDLRFDEVKITFIFEGAEEKDEVKCDMTIGFRDYNATEVPDEEFDRYYKQVDDIRRLDLITDTYNDFLNSKDANVTLTSTSTVSIAGQNKKTEETDKIHVSRGKSGFAYEIDASVGSSGYRFTYADGKKTSKSQYSSSEPTPEDCTEAEAVAYVRSLIDSLGFDPSFASDMNTIDDKTFTVTLQPDALKTVKASLTSGGLSVTSSAGGIRVELGDDGSVKKIVVTYTFGIGLSGYKGTASIVNTCDFDPAD